MNNLMPTTINGAATKDGLVFTNKLWNSIIPYNDPAIKRFFTATEPMNHASIMGRVCEVMAQERAEMPETI